MFPTIMSLACYLKAPLHRGNHNSTFPHYPTYIQDLLEDIKGDIEKGIYCGKGANKKFKNDMNAISKEVMELIVSFDVTITSDGLDYKGSSLKGCGNLIDIEVKSNDCKKGRNHSHEFKHEITNKDLPLIDPATMKVADCVFWSFRSLILVLSDHLTTLTRRTL